VHGHGQRIERRMREIAQLKINVNDPTHQRRIVCYFNASGDPRKECEREGDADYRAKELSP
jgi:hypothetical protein